jgi:hypothetical protein
MCATNAIPLGCALPLTGWHCKLCPNTEGRTDVGTDGTGTMLPITDEAMIQSVATITLTPLELGDAIVREQVLLVSAFFAHAVRAHNANRC